MGWRKKLGKRERDELGGSKGNMGLRWSLPEKMVVSCRGEHRLKREKEEEGDGR